MKQSLIVVEGPDDLAALRELFDRCFGAQKGGAVAAREHAFRWKDAETRILMANGKDKMPNLIAHRIRDLPSADWPFTQMGICFDPDRHPDEQVLTWLRKNCKVEAPWNADGMCQARVADMNLEIVALRWDLGPVFDQLKDLRNLERVALAVLAKTDPSEGKLIEELLEKVDSAKKPISWKTAFRLWAAIRYADSDPDTGGAMAHVFGQDQATRNALASVIEDSVFFSRLKRFAGAVPA
ncbi:MAG: hypothetical protein ABSE73_11580 [Planctomycetota bacterium]